MCVEHIDTVANKDVSITLPIKSYSILVKNFTNGDIRISLNSGYDSNNFILIPPYYSQEISINKRHELEYKINKISIYSECSQKLGVEVQCIMF